MKLMTQLEFITKVKIDHEFYRLNLVDYTGYQFTYKGKFNEVPDYINEIINSDITISASKKILGDEGIRLRFVGYYSGVGINKLLS